MTQEIIPPAKRAAGLQMAYHEEGYVRITFMLDGVPGPSVLFDRGQFAVLLDNLKTMKALFPPAN